MARKPARRNIRRAGRHKKIDEGFIEAGCEWMVDLKDWLNWVERRLRAQQKAFETSTIPKWEKPPDYDPTRAGGTAPPPPWGKSR